MLIPSLVIIELNANPGNDELVPERVKTLEFGVDLGFINDRVTVEATYFNSKTEDALFTVNLANSSGFANQLVNIGEIENKGFEIASNFVVIQNRYLGFRVNASLNTLDNEVTKSGAPFAIGGFSFLGSFVVEGQPVGFLRGDDPTFDDEGNLVSFEDDVNLGSPGLLR